MVFVAQLRLLRGWPLRRWIAAFATAVLAAAAVGVPTVVIPNPWFTRMTPVLWWNYPVLAATAVLGGLLVATYVAAPRARPAPSGRASTGVVGQVLSAFAVGCPVCNKLVLLAIGASGAMTYWAPLQPLVGIASIALLAWALHRRLAGELACRREPAATEA